MEEMEKEQDLVVKCKISSNLRSWGFILCLLGWLCFITGIITFVLLLIDAMDSYLSFCCIGAFIMLITLGQILRGLSCIAYESECKVALIEEKKKIKKCFELI